MYYFLFLIFLISFIFTWIIRIIALKKSIIDIPNERSSHSTPTPRGGGLAIVISWYIGIIYLYLSNQMEPNFFYALMCGLLLVIISFIDDVVNLKPFVRLIFQSLTAIGALYFLNGLQKIDIGFYQFENTLLLALPAFIGIVWFINLFNFIDGIDGYAASETIFIFLSLFILFQDFIALSLVFAVLGFLLWNWQKAKIFMGDVGSTLLGFNTAIFSIYYQNTGKSSIVILLILSSLFWFDATLTIYRRWKNKEKLSIAHRKHAYQRIVQAGFSHQKTVLWAMAINIILFLFVCISLNFKFFILPLMLLILIFLFFICLFIDKKKPF